MDKALKLTIRYVLYILLFSVLGTFFYMMFYHLLEYVPEGIPQGVSANDLFTSFFKVLSYSVFIVPAMVIDYKLKHKGNFLQCLFYILLSLVVWGLLLPVSRGMFNKFETKKLEDSYYNPLSKSQFRQYGDKVYFFGSDYNPDSVVKEKIPSVVITTTENGVVSMEQIPEEKDFDLIKAASPCRDYLVKSSYGLRNVENFVNFDEILDRMDSAKEKGITFLLGFLTLGFAVCSVYGLANISSWRLINLNCVIFATIFIFIVNTIYFHPEGSFLRNSPLINNQFFDFLSEFVDDPLLCFINILFGIVFILIGIIRFIVTSKSAKSGRKGV